ncbi:MAG: SelT/SelW/SelH family (seleno)protein [Gammaproteobacteria bacterium]|nr:SelT/SelW/SelH family (seleno)protein [Gammaproteobacteria bacterium]
MATGLAAKIVEELGIEAQLIKGVAGVFDVIADDTVIFSKLEAQRFPQDVEIIAALRHLRG